jgi:hypothetical protein
LAGLEVADPAEACDGEWSLDRFSSMEVDASIGAVVVGADPRFSYAKLAYASVCLREIPGCLFVATNPDAGDNVGACDAARASIGPVHFRYDAFRIVAEMRILSMAAK